MQKVVHKNVTKFVFYFLNFRNTTSLLHQVHIHQKYFEASHQMATDFRYTHEYGVSMVTVKQIDVDFDSINFNDTSTQIKSQAADMKNKFEAALKGNTSSGTSYAKSKFDVALMSQKSSPSGTTDFKSKFEMALASQTEQAHSVTPSPRAKFEQNLVKSMASTNQLATMGQMAGGGTPNIPRQSNGHHGIENSNYGNSSGSTMDNGMAPNGSRHSNGYNVIIPGKDHQKSSVSEERKNGEVKSGVVNAQRVSHLLHRQSDSVRDKAATKIQVRNN